MSNRIDQTFAHFKRHDKKVLIGYLTAGYPSKQAFPRLVRRLERAGLDLLEVGVPFSDPIADGPTIQQASQVALHNRVTLSWILRTVAALRPTVKMPIALMSYSNPLLAMGLQRFFQRARDAGVDGLIVPDLIPEEGRPFERWARHYGIALIYLVAPTTPLRRLKMISRATRGFLYAVSRTGVTGACRSLPPQAASFLGRIRRITSKPLAVGFGVSTPHHIRSIRRHVDGVIVGSALIDHVFHSRHASYKAAGRFVTALQRALNGSHGKEHSHAA